MCVRLFAITCSSFRSESLEILTCGYHREHFKSRGSGRSQLNWVNSCQTWVFVVLIFLSFYSWDQLDNCFRGWHILFFIWEEIFFSQKRGEWKDDTKEDRTLVSHSHGLSSVAETPVWDHPNVRVFKIWFFCMTSKRTIVTRMTGWRWRIWPSRSSFWDSLHQRSCDRMVTYITWFREESQPGLLT